MALHEGLRLVPQCFEGGTLARGIGQTTLQQVLDIEEPRSQIMLVAERRVCVVGGARSQPPTPAAVRWFDLPSLRKVQIQRCGLDQLTTQAGG